MKRALMLTAVMALFTTALSAYNPPVNGENFKELSSARANSGSLSVCGGGLFYTNPSSIYVNPALTSNQQRIDLNLGYTAMFSSNPSDSSTFGSAFQAAIILPTKWTVITVLSNGVFVPFESMDVNNTLNLKVNFAKEITDKLSVGLGLYSGVFWGADNDWSLGADLGFVYKVGDLGFLKDFRYGASVLNLGKNFDDTTATPLKSGEKLSAFPTIATFKFGVSTTLVSTEFFKLGLALDLTTPCFQNFIMDAGFECSIKDIVYINIGERLNLAEVMEGVKNNYIPSIGISCRFSFGFKNNSYMEKNGWSESELATSVSYRQIKGDINTVSAEFDLNLGAEDTTPPVITLWLDEEDE